MKKFRFIILIALFNAGLTSAALAQISNVFSTAIEVNDDVITNYELLQRSSMLQLFGARGDIRTLAENQLIDERLYQQAGKELGVTPNEDAILVGMEEFAARANLTIDEFLKILASRGVARESFYDFVKNGIIWRTVVRSRFARQVNVSDNEVDAALVQSSNRNARTSNEVLSYSQLIFPASDGSSKTTAAKARVLKSQIDTCLDLRASRDVISGSQFLEGGGTLSQISADISAQLQNLDPSESTVFTSTSGQTSLLMLCSRSRELPEEDRSNIKEVLTNQKVVGLANGYLQELKGDAYIVYK